MVVVEISNIKQIETRLTKCGHHFGSHLKSLRMNVGFQVFLDYDFHYVSEKSCRNPVNKLGSEERKDTRRTSVQNSGNAVDD